MDLWQNKDTIFPNDRKEFSNTLWLLGERIKYRKTAIMGREAGWRHSMIW